MLLGECPMAEFGSRFALGRASYELHHDELEAFRSRINSSSSLCALAQPVPAALPNFSKAATEYATWKAGHPSVLDRFDDFIATLRGKRLAVFLDYDGTLTPIVKNPDAAFMSDQMRAAVQATATLFPTSIISGRGREKVQGFVKLKELFYAGSHGMDIVGPTGPLSENQDEGSLWAPSFAVKSPIASPFSSPVSSPKGAAVAAQRQSSTSALPPHAQHTILQMGSPSAVPTTIPLTAAHPHASNPPVALPNANTSNAMGHTVQPVPAALIEPQGQGPAEAQQAEEQLAFQPAAKFAPIMDAVHDALCQRVKAIPGAAVEHNKFCVSVHFRNCSPESYDAVVAAVKDTLQEHSNLKASRGRKVLEIQPQVDWGKGRALAHMLVALGLDQADDVIPIYLGDDRTDEDAFKVLKERSAGLGILISSKAKPTDAQFTLNDPSEVMTFLEQLVLWGSTAENAWHERQSCTGWALKAKSPFIVHNASATALSAATPDGAATASRQPSFSNAALADGGIAEDSATAGTSDSQDSTADAERDMQRAQAAFQTDQPSSAEPRKCASGLPTDSMHSAQGRPPTTAAAGTLDSADFRRPARNADMYDARRTSLDHYLSSSEASFTQAQQPKHDPVVTSSQPQHLPPNQGGVSDMTLDKNGERLTALLLDKLHGHASRSSDQEEMSSPPALTSNDSGSMAGYRSPFESLASYSYGIPEEADSLHAEYGSAASLLVMPSAELKD